MIRFHFKLIATKQGLKNACLNFDMNGILIWNVLPFHPLMKHEAIPTSKPQAILQKSSHEREGHMLYMKTILTCVF